MTTGSGAMGGSSGMTNTPRRGKRRRRINAPRSPQFSRLWPGRRQQVAVLRHAELGLVVAGDAVGQEVLRRAARDRVLVVPPHGQDLRPGPGLTRAALVVLLAHAQFGDAHV